MMFTHNRNREEHRDPIFQAGNLSEYEKKQLTEAIGIFKKIEQESTDTRSQAERQLIWEIRAGKMDSPYARALMSTSHAETGSITAARQEIDRYTKLLKS
jgi:hypothetical protein